MDKNINIWYPQILFTKTSALRTWTSPQKINTIHKFVNNIEFKHLVTNMIYSFQLESGISIPVLENNKWEIKYVNSTRTTTLVQELQ